MFVFTLTHVCPAFVVLSINPNSPQAKPICELIKYIHHKEHYSTKVDCFATKLLNLWFSLLFPWSTNSINLYLDLQNEVPLMRLLFGRAIDPHELPPLEVLKIYVVVGARSTSSKSKLRIYKKHITNGLRNARRKQFAKSFHH